MPGNIFAYVQQIQMLVFFSGYPLVYYLIQFLSRIKSLKNVMRESLISILPFAYALMGTLYLGLELKNLYHGYNIENVSDRIQEPYLFIWAFLSILFWIPAVSRRPILSVLHSLVFFIIIVKDLFLQIAGYSHDRNILTNDMKVYTASVILNLATFVLLVCLYYLLAFRKKNSKL
jgi:hypothetical protein